MNFRNQRKRSLQRRDFFTKDIALVAKQDKYLLSNMNSMASIIKKLGAHEKGDRLLLIANNAEDKSLLKRLAYLGYKEPIKDNENALGYIFPVSLNCFYHRHAQVVSYFE